MEGVRVRLEQQLVLLSGQAELIHIVLADAGDERLPDALVQLGHRVGTRHPAVEIAHHADGFGVGRPDAEHHAFVPAPAVEMSAEEPICLKIVALLEQVYGQIGRIILFFTVSPSLWALRLTFTYNLTHFWGAFQGFSVIYC